jgi:tetratricopeptide (TPR) repeat protein
MPSHTFTRLGYWEDSIATNLLSAAAAKKTGQVYEELHAMDYAVYAYLQTGQDAQAKALVDAAPGVATQANATAGAAPPAAGGYALAAIPARYALERGAWADAARVQPQPSSAPYIEAISWFARGLGAARAGMPGGGPDVLPELQSRIDRLKAVGEQYWAEQVTIQKLVVAAWVALSQGKTPEALASMREAADREDRTEKAAISPGPLAPARELLAEMLLQLKQPKEALAEFEKTMAKEPNRFRGVAGAITAAEQLGDHATAKRLAERLRTIAAKGDTPGRPALQAARAMQ